METIGKDQLEQKLARMRTKSECQGDRKLSETSGTISPSKSGSGLNLNSSQENVRKRLVEPKEEKSKTLEKPKTNEKQVRRSLIFSRIKKMFANALVTCLLLNLVLLESSLLESFNVFAFLNSAKWLTINVNKQGNTPLYVE